MKELISKYNLDENKVKSDPSEDVLSITRSYTKTYEVEYVPTLIVNGSKVADPFNINEIEKLLK
jgi:hypothetical protein